MKPVLPNRSEIIVNGLSIVSIKWGFKVYMDWRCLQVMEEAVVQRLHALIDWMVPACLKYVRSNVTDVVPTLDAGLVRSCLRVLESLLSPVPAEADQRTAGLRFPVALLMQADNYLLWDEFPLLLLSACQFWVQPTMEEKVLKEQG